MCNYIQWCRSIGISATIDRGVVYKQGCDYKGVYSSTDTCAAEVYQYSRSLIDRV